MNILITGAAGFLGSHLSLHHLREGDSVVCFDDFSSSQEISYQMGLMSKFSNMEFLTGDISHSSFFFRATASTKKFDKIYNFACPASPPRYQSMPIKTMMTCTAGVKNVLDVAAAHGSVVVHASTSEIYGDPHRNPQDESYRGNVNSYGPRSCYDEGKRAAEALCYDYLNTLGVDARLVRIFNTYGPHMDPFDGRVISNFINQALRGDPITVYGDGNQTRSFCYVDDLIRGIVAMGNLEKNPRCPINLGNPDEFSMNRLVEILSSKIQISSLKHEMLPVDDPLQRCPDISLAKNLLNWSPSVNLDEGLDKTIEYFRMVNAA